MGFRSRRGDELVTAMLAGAQTPAQRALLATLQIEGVTPDDVRAWWNLSDKQQEKAKTAMVALRGAVYLARKERGDSEEDAMRFAARSLAFYGDPSDSVGRLELSGDDRPLPWELEPRVSAWLSRRGFSSGGRNDMRSLGGHSSVNSWVRAEIAARRL